MSAQALTDLLPTLSDVGYDVWIITRVKESAMAAVTPTAEAKQAHEESALPMLIDTDVHEVMGSTDELVPYMSPAWQRYFTQYCGHFGPFAPSSFPYAHPMTAGGRADWIEPGAPAPGTSLELMRKQLLGGEGVTTAILCGISGYATLQGNYELAAAICAAYNDWQIEHWLDQEPRLRGSVHVHPHDPEVAAREIDRVAAHPQIVQVFLPSVTDRQYGDPYYRPIFEAALRNDLVVTFHHFLATQTVLGYPRYYIEFHTVAAPHAAQNQILSMICNGLFDKYPELKVLFLETGVGWVPWFMSRLDQQYRELRVEVPWVKELPSRRMRENVRIATQPMGDTPPGELVRIVESTDTEQVFVFSTDYPHYDADTANIVLPRTLPESLRRRVCYQNALETFPRLAGLAASLPAGPS